MAQNLRLAVRRLARPAGLRRRGHRHPGPRHRRQRRDVQRGARGAARAAALRRRRTRWCASSGSTRTTARPATCRRPTSSTSSATPARSPGWAPTGSWARRPISGAEGDAERVGVGEGHRGLLPHARHRGRRTGRLFTPDDDRPGAPKVALDQRRLLATALRRGAPTSSARRSGVSAEPYTVIGVLPPSYRHIEEDPDRSADVFLPCGLRPGHGHPQRALHPRRRPTGSRRLPRAGARRARSHRAAAAAGSIPTQQPRQDGASLRRCSTAMVSDVRRSLVVLAAAVGLVLLIACANLANLLLAAGAGRQREFAVRTALGADRRRLVGQLLAESLVLSALGGAAGLALAAWGTRAATLLAAAAIPRAADIRIDGSVLAFVALAAVVSAVLFGLAPALHLSATSLHGALKEGGRTPGSFVPQRVRDGFMGAQVALAVVLLVGATLARAQPVEAGGRAAGILTGARHGHGRVAADGGLSRGQPDSRSTSGCRSVSAPCPVSTRVGAVNILPLSANYDSRGVQVEDHPRPEGQGLSPQARSVTPGYFAALGVPLLRGRLFDARDAVDGPLVVVISDAMARQYWPGEDPLGRRLTFNSGIPREHAAGGRRRRIARGDRHRRRRAPPGPRRGAGADVLHAAHPAAVVPHDDAGRAHGGRRARAGRRGARRAAPDGRRRAALPGAHGGPGAVARGGPAAPARLAAGALRRPGRGAGRARRLRRGQLRRAAAHRTRSACAWPSAPAARRADADARPGHAAGASPAWCSAWSARRR